MDPPVVDPNGKKLLEPSEEEDATPEATDLGQIICLHIGIGSNVCWNKSNTMLGSQTHYLVG